MKLFSQKRARRILDEGAENSDEQALQEALNKRERIIDKVIHSASLAPYLEQVKTLFALIQDYVKGSYREIPWWSIGSVATALLYILMPLDAVPDFIPIAGFLDDAVVLKLCLDLIGKDLDKYRQYKNGAVSDADVADDDATPPPQN